MKKIFLAFAITMAVATTVNAAETNSYFVNDAQIENVFASSTEISSTEISTNVFSTSTASINLAENKHASFKGSDKSAAVAILVCFFIGGLGVHRAYLGTETMTWVGYILTCGGIFGIVPLVDFFTMIFNGVDKYTDNPKFFMW